MIKRIIQILIFSSILLNGNLLSINAQSFPGSYDLRAVNTGAGVQSWVSTIQNQGTAEDCWTFASATAMDSNLLKSGIIPTASTPPPIIISSWHLSTNNGAPDQLVASEAFNNNSNWGGDMFQALGYVTRGTGEWQIPNASATVEPGLGYKYRQTMGGGPVLDAQYPLNPFPVSITNWSGYPPYLGAILPAASQSIPYRVTSMAFYDQGFSNNVALPTSTGNVTIQGSTYATYDFNLGAADPQVAAIKNAMIQNGAVTTYMNANGNFHTVEGTPTNTIQYFNGQNATAYSDHAVTIIGWNDTYTMTDPRTNITSTGAWLVQNSWGSTSWNNSNGTFWASYNDAVIGRSGVSTFNLAPNAGYSTTVIQNELGPMDYSGNYYGVANVNPVGMGAPTGMATRTENTVASRLTPTSNGQLLALGLFTQVADVVIQVGIYDSWSNGPSNLLSSANYTLSNIGYFQADLPNSLSLTASDDIVVQLTYLDGETLAPVANAIPITVGGSGLNGYTTVNHGLSYYLGSNSTWLDFADVSYPSYYSGSPDITGGILFLKGITAYSLPDFTWTGNASSGWNSASNWADNQVPTAGMVAYFCTSNQTSIDTETDQNLGGIVFNNCAPSYTISNNTITLTGSVVNNSANSQTINSNIAVASSLAFNAASGNLTFGGAIVMSSNATVLAIGGNAPTVISGVISGNGALDLASNSNLVLSANNTYTGGTTLLSGTLQAMAPSALGNGSLILSGGSLAVGAQGSPALTLGGITLLNWASANSTIAIPSSANISVSGNFTNGGFSGNRTFYFGQPELLQIGNNTLVTFGSANFTHSNFLATAPSNISMNGTFQIVGNSLVYTLAGGSASGSSISSATVPTWATFNVTGSTSTIGFSNTVNALNFTNNGNLAIQSNGQLVVSSGTMAVQSGSSVVSGGNLTTPGNFNKSGAGELDVQSNMSVNGTASVDQGLLSVNGNLLANNVAVNPGGTLGGNGTIYCNVNVQGNLSPGNSPGTLTIAGNLVLSSASATNIEIASLTSFDRIIVGGTATLSGTVNIIPYGGNTLAYGQQYNIIQAGSITGDFASITAPETFRGRFLNGGTVGTLLIAPDTYTRVAVTPNQRAVAKALDGFIPATSGDRLFVSTMLDLQTAEQYPAAFQQIMPGFYESLANMAIEQTYNQTQLLNQRMSSLRFGVAGFQAMGVSQPIKYDKDGKSVADAKTASPIVENGAATNWNSWVLADGEFSNSGGLAGVPNYHNNAGGFLFGADYRCGANFSSGLFAGYEYNYAKYNGGSSTEGNSALFGLYGSYANERGYYADAVVSGGYTGYQTRRSIQFGAIDRTGRANPNSGQFSAALNIGKDFEIGKFTLGPIASAQYTYAGVGGFTESGAQSLDLALGQQNASSLRSNLGARLAYTWAVSKKLTLIPEVRGFWMHEFLNNGWNINAALDGGSGASFGYETANPYSNSAFGGVGVTAKLGDRWSGSVFYNVNFGSENYNNNIISTMFNFAF